MFCAGLAHGMRCALSLVGAMSRVEGGSPPPLQQFVVQAVQEDPRLGTQSVPGRLLLVRAHNSARAPGGSHFSLARPTSSACFEQHARPLPQGGGLQFFRRLLITFAPQIRHSGAARHTIRHRRDFDEDKATVLLWTKVFLKEIDSLERRVDRLAPTTVLFTQRSRK